MSNSEPWKMHPLCVAGKVELVPTEWVWKYWGADVSPKTDLLDGTLVGLDDLWKNLREQGMLNPLIMRVGIRNKKFRLESGNHRIQIFHKHGIPMIPVTVQIKDECGPNAPDVMTDATHNFDIEDDLQQIDGGEEYRKPSEVFKSLEGKTRAA